MVTYEVEIIDLSGGVNLEMVLIPSGTFMMGSPDKEKFRFENEAQHEVTISKPFYMGIYQVTQEQWKMVMGNNPSYSKGEKLLVTDVSWGECQEFIKKLNFKIKRGYRLPTEAEWEYACRAGTTTAYSFGDSITPQNANYDDSGMGKPAAIGSYKANAFGVNDMHGNVFEWCEDWYSDYPKGTVSDPRGPNSGEYRVLRGGSFLNNTRVARSASRGGSTPDNRYYDSGFRLVRAP